jgi:hypothetical protein
MENMPLSHQTINAKLQGFNRLEAVLKLNRPTKIEEINHNNSEI